ncbi:2-phospho-L-lactate guanylyltransferase [Planctomycetes bacterium Pla86]|uniref:2-phospho-L-lactate guanylyltransferase n=1 Tax=Engelhardtia mirabilis TaxID=2528011 RepID=A0A518BRH3_9BACT|nr:2-phospho-L-lactate guanylyltransferase [Planctomycetes bacterium Pla133]QDV03901.1 2-phospho-L-lactate guanylyltransferase [Planctomycetes bacterium Pla86]
MPTLIVFTRWPEPGRTKTRLIGTLGAERAALLQAALTARTLDAAREAAARIPGLRIQVRFDGGEPARMAGRFGDDLTYLPQGQGDLGARLATALGSAFAGGGGPVAVIGSDCPGLDSDFLVDAFEAMLPGRAVLGPALDGGYTLLGLVAPHPALFEGVPWGTAGVLAQTRNRAEEAGLAVHLLCPLADVDRPEDLSLVDDLLSELDGL